MAPRASALRPLWASTVHLGAMDKWGAAIVIPARDEQARLPACLDAAGAAANAVAGVNVGIVVVVNNTNDATAVRALSWAMAHPSQPLVLIECAFSPEDAGAGAARRLGLDTACSRLTPHGALLMTDADSLVRPDWVSSHLADLRRADLICGAITGRPDEARALPQATAAHASAEHRYLAASIRLVAQLDPQPHDPAPAHHSTAGASMAVSRAVYEAVGGLPPLPVDEDRAFARLLEAHDYRIRFSAASVVEASCRMTGRTAGGMAGTLRAWAYQADPWADEWLERPGALALRHGLRGRLRAVWPDRAALGGVLRDALGPVHAKMILSEHPGHYFGAFFARVERLTPRLARQRLRMSDCRRELPHLLALAKTGEAGPERMTELSAGGRRAAV